VYSKCAWVAGIIQKHVAGKPVAYDASSLAGAVVEVSGGRVECKLCGRVVRLAMLKHHLQSKHCDRLLELLEKHKLARTRVYGRGGASTFNVQFYCARCGWSHSMTVRSNTGPPSVKRLLEKMGLTECPACGKQFKVKGVEFS
jgi:transcription elongation factor Elf1